MNGADLSEEHLAALLREAQRAHREYERTLGERDDDWPAWYARFIVERLSSEES